MSLRLGDTARGSRLAFSTMEIPLSASSIMWTLKS